VFDYKIFSLLHLFACGCQHDFCSILIFSEQIKIHASGLAMQNKTTGGMRSP
jgi:hypothetical protein